MRRRDTAQQRRAEQKCGRVEHESLPSAHGEDERGAQRGADQDGHVLGDRGQRPRILEKGFRDGLGQQAGIGGLEEGSGGPEQRLDHHHLKNRRSTGENQRGQDTVQSGTGEVGDDHDPVAGQSVGPDAPEQDQHDEGKRLRGQHQSEVGRRPGALGDVERQGDDHGLVADRAGRLPQEQEAKVSVAQDAQVGAHGQSIAGSINRLSPCRRRYRRAFSPTSSGLPVDRIRAGYYSDAYFVYTKELLEAEGEHPHVTMQVFQKEDSILGGIDEAIAVLKTCAGRMVDGEFISGWDQLVVNALHEGDRISPRETVMTIEGDYTLFAHLETVYLGSLARRSLIMRNVNEVVRAARR